MFYYNLVSSLSMFLKESLVFNFLLIFTNYVHGQDLSVLGYFDCMFLLSYKIIIIEALITFFL